AREVSLAGALSGRGLALRADLLRPWAHWITPEAEPRRYDTRFFVAAVPAGQRARHVTGEADEASWLRPADALAEHAARTRPPRPAAADPGHAARPALLPGRGRRAGRRAAAADQPGAAHRGDGRRRRGGGDPGRLPDPAAGRLPAPVRRAMNATGHPAYGEL